MLVNNDIIHTNKFTTEPNELNTLLKLVKQYISTGSFLLLSLVVYLFSDSNEYAKQLMDEALPINGKLLAFVTFLGLVFTYEACLKKSTENKLENANIKDSIFDLQVLIEKRHLISDVNQAYSEFKSSNHEFITGEYYIKEIHTLNDTREKLKVNSYTQNKLDFLMSKIQND